MTTAAPALPVPADLAEAEVVRLKNYEAWRALGVDPYDGKFRPDTSAGALQVRYRDLANGQATSECVKLSGRIATIRNSGMFIDLHGPDGKFRFFTTSRPLRRSGRKNCPCSISATSWALRARSVARRAGS